MTSTPNVVSEALAFYRNQHKNPTRSWKNRCLELFRTAYGCPDGIYDTAYHQWLNTPADRKHVGGKPGDAPIGSGLCYKGTGPDGHIMIAAHPFPNGTPAAWSNDLVKTGSVNKVARNAPEKVWGQTYLGYIKNVADRDIVKRI